MAAIVTLTATRKAKLVKLLNNLNLGFVYSGFGEAFTAMLDGAPLTLDEAHKAELKHLINNLNLGTFHAKAGDLLVDLMDHGTANATAQAMTEAQTTQLAALFHNLNMGLAEVDVGDLIVTSVADLAVSAPKLLWNGAAPTKGTVGKDLSFNWKGGTAPYTVKLTDPSNADTTKGPDNALTYTFATTGKAAGKWSLVVEDAAGVQLKQDVTLNAALAWDGAAPTTGTIGTKVSFKWKGGTQEYNVVSQEPNGKEHDNLRTPTLTYDMNSASEPAGDWTVTVTDAAGAQLTQKVTMAAAPKVLKTIKLTGKEIALTGDATAGYVIADLKIDASNQDEITVAVATDVGAAMPADAAIKVEIFTAANSADLAKLEAISVSGGKFIIKAAATGAPADGDTIDLKVTAGAAAPVKLSAKFIA
ncbi:hypothetical protein BIW22_20970 [Salmonella enterica]|nr:hypothetical protein [Salmonella enterica]